MEEAAKYLNVLNNKKNKIQRIFHGVSFLVNFVLYDTEWEIKIKQIQGLRFRNDKIVVY